FYQTAARLGLIKFSAQHSFANRNRPGGRSFLVNSRGSGTNLSLRKMVINALTEGLFSLPECDVIGGVANSGTQWAAILSYKLNMPFANILKEPRKSGMRRQVEGDIQGKKVVLVDDWMNTGGSILTAIDTVKSHGGIPVGLLLIAGEEAVHHDFEFPYAFAISTQLLIEAAAKLDLIPEELKNDFLTIK
ncbi:MAG TPA: phosphoribosyltransferase family protein, partial [Chitinophagaceae bacterium]|nr:phosphoribosyltransferase family protein [Chitinophagaceae bacterium]